MINKDVCKSLARKKRNEILIWIWNNSITELSKRYVITCIKKVNNNKTKPKL